MSAVTTIIERVSLEFVVAVAGVALSVATYILGARAGKRSEATIRQDVAALPNRMAETVSSMLDGVGQPSRNDETDRGWDLQEGATVGTARIKPDGSPATLVEFPYGAHTAVLLAMEDTGDPRTRLGVIGVVTNGTGARFHVRESTDSVGHEVVTVDYIEPLDLQRSLAEMPIQTIYYRLDASGFREVGRGDVYDPSEQTAWDVPKSVEPFLSHAWLHDVRS